MMGSIPFHPVCAPTQPPTQPAPTVEPHVGTVTEIAPNWKVIFHNDDVTTFEFVIGSLMRFFGYDYARALDLTSEVHFTGAAVVAVLPFEDAEFKQEQVTSAARGAGYPLCVTIEPDS
jgi:ATP-dependent Clp protease adaptor protein ClpS